MVSENGVKYGITKLLFGALSPTPEEKLAKSVTILARPWLVEWLIVALLDGTWVPVAFRDNGLEFLRLVQLSELKELKDMQIIAEFVLVKMLLNDASGSELESALIAAGATGLPGLLVRALVLSLEGNAVTLVGRKKLADLISGDPEWLEVFSSVLDQVKTLVWAHTFNSLFGH